MVVVLLVGLAGHVAAYNGVQIDQWAWTMYWLIVVLRFISLVVTSIKEVESD